MVVLYYIQFILTYLIWNVYNLQRNDVIIISDYETSSLDSQSNLLTCLVIAK